MFTREKLQDIRETAHLILTSGAIRKDFAKQLAKLRDASNLLDALMARDGEIDEE